MSEIKKVYWGDKEIISPRLIGNVIQTNNLINQKESERQLSEAERQLAEIDRETNTTNAINATNTATTNANNAATNANTVAQNVSDAEVVRQEFYNEYKKLESYDPDKAYKVGNKVTDQGGTYQCILETIGNAPTYNTDNTWWKCIAAKGTDGVGGDMMSSIYDPQGKATDVFAYADEKIGDLSLLETTSNADLVGAVNELELNKINSSEKGNPNGVSTLSDNGKINKSQLPIIGQFKTNVMYNYIKYSDDYMVMQGGCYVKIDNQETLVICYATTINEVGDYQKLVEIDLYTGNTIREAVLPIGHGNDIEYKEGNLYITSTGTDIYVIDYATFTLTNTIVKNYNCISLTYNIDNNEWYVLTTGTNEYLTIKVLDNEMNFVKDVNIGLPKKTGTNGCGLTYHDHVLYMLCFSPDICICVNTIDMTIQKIFENPIKLQRHVLMESEFITNDGTGNFYIGWNTPSNNERNFFETFITKTDFNIQTSDRTKQIYQNAAPNPIITLYVDNSYNGVMMNGTATNPFKEIQQAINSIPLIESGCAVVVEISSGSYSGVRIHGIDSLYLNAPSSADVKGILITDSTISLLNINVTQNNPLSAYAIRSERSYVSMLNVTCSTANFIDANFGGLISISGAISKPCNVNQSKIDVNKSAVHAGITKTNPNSTIIGRNVLYTNTSDIPTTFELVDYPDYYSMLVVELNINGISQSFPINKTSQTQAVWKNINSDGSSISYQVRFSYSGKTVTTSMQNGQNLTSSGIASYSPSTKGVRIYGIL
jgi:hypothetical protein